MDTWHRLKPKAEGTQRTHLPPTSSTPTKFEGFPSGIKLLWDSKSSIVDIIFVHGLTGDREKTWTAKEAKLPWPQILLPGKVPNARILTYGYDAYPADWRSMVSENRIGDHAMNLLTSVNTYREEDDTNNRPIIFVCHSLGGLVCEDALVQASQPPEDHLRSTLHSTRGVILLGTPHQGSGLAQWSEKLAKSVGVLRQTNAEIIAVLKTESEVLARIQRSFHAIIRSRVKEGLKPIDITCFYEELPLPVVGMVVPSQSAILPGYTPIGIHNNHMDMTKFASEDDPGFKAVVGELRRWVKAINEQQQEITSLPYSHEKRHRLSLDRDQIQMLMNSLQFDQIDARHRTIRNAHPKTCEWLLQSTQYLHWLDATKLHEHHGFFWIKGKAGTGKSTLMKSALANACEVMRDRVIISFFFNARGVDLEKSTTGMYRTLLLQLLSQLPALQHIFESLRLSHSSICKEYQWSTESLKTLLEQAILYLRETSVIFFIDALDECEEDQIRDMISFFEHVGKQSVSGGIRFQVCFSSRHYPHITTHNSLELILEEQEGHQHDITSYVDSKLKIGSGSESKQVRRNLLAKASGVFLWINLVVEILNKEYDSGRIHMLLQKLEELPGDLHKLLGDILTRGPDNRDALVLCIQWILFAERPLRPKELYSAIRMGIESGNLSAWDPNNITKNTVKRFILDSSKGLAEITKARTPTVQFIHESVKDFLLKENGLGKIWPELETNREGQSHEQLKEICIRYMSIDVFALLKLPDVFTLVQLPNAFFPGKNYFSPLRVSSKRSTYRRSASSAFPLLQYAVHSVLYHADTAAGHGIPQGQLLQTFPLVQWIQLDNLMQQYDDTMHIQDASLLYILAGSHRSNLLRSHPSIIPYLQAEKGYFQPLQSPPHTRGNGECIQAFVVADVDNAGPTKLQHYFEFSSRFAVLSYVTEQHNTTMLAWLLATGKSEVGSKDEDIQRDTLLWWAADRGHEGMVKKMVELGANINSYGKERHTPLWWAVENRNEEVVKLLLALGADVESTNKIGVSPLFAAVLGSWRVSERDVEIVKLLLVAGADANFRDIAGLTPLLCAASLGDKEKVKLLLAAGADVELKNKNGLTPLSSAIQIGDEGVVELLLAAGADIESDDINGRTLLSYAAARKYWGIFKVLQSHLDLRK